MNETLTTEQVWELLGTKLKAFLSRRISDKQVVEDLHQEAFVRIHKKLDEIDDMRRITPWVFQIARNLIVDHYRSRARQAAEIADELETKNESDEHLNELVAGWLPGMIAQLPEPYREAVELYELKGVPQQELADRLGISLSGAKSRVQRGRAKLKSILLECCTLEQDSRGNVIEYRSNDSSNGCEC